MVRRSLCSLAFAGPEKVLQREEVGVESGHEGPRGHSDVGEGRLDFVTTAGSHRQFKHPAKLGRVTVSGGLGDDMPKGTLASVLRQAGLKGARR